jgi:hypothetical protein
VHTPHNVTGHEAPTAFLPPGDKNGPPPFKEAQLLCEGRAGRRTGYRVCVAASKSFWPSDVKPKRRSRLSCKQKI